MYVCENALVIGRGSRGGGRGRDGEGVWEACKGGRVEGTLGREGGSEGGREGRSACAYECMGGIFILILCIYMYNVGTYQ